MVKPSRVTLRSTASSSPRSSKVVKGEESFFGVRQGWRTGLADKVKVAKHRHAGARRKRKRATITQENCRRPVHSATGINAINHGSLCFPRKICSRAHLRCSRIETNVCRILCAAAPQKAAPTRSFSQYKARFRLRPEPLPSGERRGGAINAGAQRHHRQAAWP